MSLNLPPGTLIDAHAHLDTAGGFPALAIGPDDQPPTHVIAVTNLPRRYERLHALHHDRVTWSLGLHPAQPHPASAIDDFFALLPGCDVIGEVGLDGTPPTNPHHVPMTKQRDELEQILNHPSAATRLVSIHSRRAAKATIEHLRVAAIPGAVLHWFTGTPTQAIAATDAGAWFSINHRMHRNTELLAAIPTHRVLLETDAPHTGKTTKPGDVRPVVAMLATAWGATTSAVEDQIHDNQHRLTRALTDGSGK